MKKLSLGPLLSMTNFRIILALDLVIWYVWSLKFITAIKIFSPKVFMVQNMVSWSVGCISLDDFFLLNTYNDAISQMIVERYNLSLRNNTFQSF
jgi:hypothetical protein